MNKLFTKVAALTLGVAMAAGVGVALGSAKASEAKAASGASVTGYTQCTSVDDIANHTSGKFLIAGVTGSDTLFLTNGQTSAGRINGVPSASLVTDDSEFEIVYDSTSVSGKEGYTIKGASKYYGYGTSGTNIAVSDSVSSANFLWTISVVDGRFRVVNTGTASASTVRCLVFRAGSTNQFAAYSQANINNTEYFDVEFYYASSTPVPVTQYNVTDSVENGSVSPSKVNEGATLTATITPGTGYELPATLTDVTMGGSSVVHSYNAETGVVTVENVTGDIVITGSCPEKQAPQPVDLPDGDYTATLAYANPFPTEIDVLDGQSAKVAALTSSVSAVKTYDDTHHEYVLAKDAYFEINNLTNGVIKSISFNLYQYRNMNVFVDDSTTAVYTGDGQKGSGDPVVVEVETNAQSKIKVVSNGGTGSYDLKMYSLDINIKVGTAVTPVTGVSLNAQSGKIAVGTTRQLTATVAPSSATNKNVSWSAEPESVATVSSSGLVTGVAAGEAVITVTTEDGGFTASYTATVGVPNYGTENAPLTVEEAHEALEYTDATVTSSKLYVYGKVYSSKYSGTSYNDYTIWLTNSDESVDKYFEIYGGEISEAITSDDTVDDALKGELVICHGYGKVHNGSTFELLKANDEKPSVAKYQAPQPVTYEVSFYEGNTGGGSQYAEGAKVTIPQPTESLIPEGKEFDYWEHKETGDHYAPGDEFTVGTSSARFDAVYKDKDWSADQKAALETALHGYLPPYFGELVEDLTTTENGATFTVSGDQSGEFATKLGDGWNLVSDNNYMMVGDNYYLTASIDVFGVRSDLPVGDYSTISFTYNEGEAPATDWSDSFKESYAAMFGDEAPLPDFINSAFADDSNITFDTQYYVCQIDVVGNYFEEADNHFYGNANWNYIGPSNVLPTNQGYCYEGKDQATEVTVGVYMGQDQQVHTVIFFGVIWTIEVETDGAKLEYFVGDTLDTTNIIVHYTTSYGDWTNYFNLNSVCTFSPTTLTEAGDEVAIDISIFDGSYHKSYNVKVEEVVATSLVVSGTPTKTEYEAGEDWSAEGLVVTAHYNNGTEADVTDQVTWSFDPAETAVEVTSVSAVAHLGDLSSDAFVIDVTVEQSYGADAFAKDLLEMVAPICANYDGKKNNKAALKTVWDTMSQRYSTLSNEGKAKVIAAAAKTDGTDLEKAMAFYNYACKKYGLTKFIEGRQVKALVAEHETGNSILPIVVIVASSVAAITAIGVVIALKRRKALLAK